MIVAPTSCYFVIKAEGEAAAAVILEVSPTTGHDITTAILVSADFETDILAVNYMDKAMARIIAGSGPDIETTVRYNSLYIPGPMEAIDDLLNLDPRNDGIRFVGMSGNPFLLKTVEAKSGDENVVTAKVEYRPFDIPGYNEMVESNAKMRLN
jgi:hypothetical protein